MYWPLIWFGVGAQLDDDRMVSLIKVMSMTPSIGLGIGIVLAVIGAVNIVIAVVFLVKSKYTCE